MKKFKFSLEKVLQLKDQLLRSLKSDLNILNVQLKAKEITIGKLKLDYKKSNDLYNIKSSERIMPYEIKQYKDYMDVILNKIKKEEEEKEIILKKIELKKQEIINMNIEISTIEKLKERKLSEYNYEVQKDEEIFINEFISNVSIANLQN